MKDGVTENTRPPSATAWALLGFVCARSLVFFLSRKINMAFSCLLGCLAFLARRLVNYRMKTVQRRCRVAATVLHNRFDCYGPFERRLELPSLPIVMNTFG